ncbi:hypothetical protein GYMLUDRAFT_245711 [Collybiopsis luxurians FD-317 M1]|uniref:MYND-type domain-containing protein n=1 Tax=Collybiopsis luxurians FD-317 M1 TaxID=944289 RepID=A0A0D0C8Z1_9AGAR|nr:hypothetical protein GYMLUDRAFT_245711 [Collybiopsis luxurians FD-317 M1]
MDPIVKLLPVSLSAEATAVLLSAGKVPPPPRYRHPASDPAEPMRRQLDQCSECFVSHTVSRPLKKCTGCLIAKYCGRECQKKAWPAHKPISTEALWKFVAKHQLTIARTALEAFKLQSRPQQALHNVLVIYVTDRRHLFPGSRVHRETAFYVTDANVRDIGNVESIKDMLQDEVVRINMEARKKGYKGSVFVLVLCGNLRISINTPIDFKYDVRETDDAGDGWKQTLFTYLNNGIVV